MNEEIRLKIFKGIALGRINRHEIIKYATRGYNKKEVESTLRFMEKRKQIKFEIIKTFKHPKGINIIKNNFGLEQNYVLDVAGKLPKLGTAEITKTHDNLAHGISIKETKKELNKLGFKPRENRKFKVVEGRKLLYCPDLMSTYAYEVETGKMRKDLFIAKLCKFIEVDYIKKMIIVVPNYYVKNKYKKLLSDILYDESTAKYVSKFEKEYGCKNSLKHEINRIIILRFNELKQVKLLK